MSYVITTDSGSGLNGRQINRYKLKLLPFCYTINGTEYSGGAEMSGRQLKEFYEKLRGRADIKTSAVQRYAATVFFEEILKSGTDVLHISFSSTFSSSYAVVKSVLDELSEEYPERKIYCVDSCCASLGEGLLAIDAAKLRDAGKDIDGLHRWIENHKMNVCHMISADDLFYFKRGGRLSAVSAVIGTVLSIKPLLQIDGESKIVQAVRVRGRKAMINEMVSRMEKNALPLENQIIYIAHADCREYAEELADEIRKRFGVRGVEINYADPVIGSHAGPGAVGLFYFGKSRD